MITIRFYNNDRKNSKVLKTYNFTYNEYTELNYIYTVLSYIIQFRPKYYTIELFKSYKSLYNGYEYTFNSFGYRQYIKIYDIESVINVLVGYAFEDIGKATLELSKIHYQTITRDLINKYYHN